MRESKFPPKIWKSLFESFFIFFKVESSKLNQNYILLLTILIKWKKTMQF